MIVQGVFFFTFHRNLFGDPLSFELSDFFLMPHLGVFSFSKAVFAAPFRKCLTIHLS